MNRLLLLLLLASACTGYAGGSRSVTPLDLEQEGWLRAPGVPVIRQQAIADCGPAAAAMVVGRWQGVQVGKELLAARDERTTTMRASELRDVVTATGLRAFVIEGRYADLAHELEAGRPVIVGTIKPRHDGRGYRHYEVVVALHLDGRVATIDPSLGWRQYARKDFELEWKAAKHTTIVVLPPGGDASQ